jgi:hypothetical protein
LSNYFYIVLTLDRLITLNSFGSEYAENITMTIKMWLYNNLSAIAVFAVFFLISSFATAGTDLIVSTTGLSAANFGMDIESVERALGKQLLLPKGKSKAQLGRLQCSYIGIAGLTDLILRFEMGRFTAIDVNKPNVTTKPGVKIGDPEKIIIDKFRTDPTYSRNSNRYDEATKEIILGKYVMVGSGDARRARGSLIKFTSEKGQITHIQTGSADYVLLDEHDEDCASFE